MTLSQLAAAVHAKHCSSGRGFPAGWLLWVLWARRTIGWMRPM